MSVRGSSSSGTLHNRPNADKWEARTPYLTLTADASASAAAATCSSAATLRLSYAALPSKLLGSQCYCAAGLTVGSVPFKAAFDRLAIHLVSCPGPLAVDYLGAREPRLRVFPIFCLMRRAASFSHISQGPLSSCLFGRRGTGYPSAPNCQEADIRTQAIRERKDARGIGNKCKKNAALQVTLANR
ncbi:hypothetical protein JMJ77_0005349 [Colletotrichum scovillei]|uniref:Uncharacterized protein n=1 Tax=Colletotrichum scovillei TaxID=1209932 RepID=A0A9P7UHD7_9PEZI|nr:hypothetical protein JMJ77_0005349 [Colletotrichum scovillei]KAG7076566.1 hypothetical protein JMJ76_0013828 [Colletotrichum scovillei]KAG7083642.1 hypothetical protein JMJ78_0009086 [Colletotrichum scovillei]